MAGDTKELVFNHPNVGRRTYYVQADQGITFSLGGYNKERQQNGVPGSGHAKMNAKPWMLEGLQLEIDMTNDDLEYIQDITDSPIDCTITWDHIDGYIYEMQGSTEGEIKVDSRNQSNIPGIFAAGDVTDVVEKQIVIACGEGSKACLSAFKYLATTKF